MGDHKRSKRFKEDSFDIKILEEDSSRDYIEQREEYWIKELDTFKNGLNESWSGKGCGHRSPNFTTLGYVFSEESRKKMSTSAKKRAKEEGFEVRSQRSKDNFKNPEYVAKQVAAKKGKRLRPPKLSDEQVVEIRDFYESILFQLKKECEVINEERHNKNPSWKKTNEAQLFGRKYSGHYGVSLVLLRDIVLWKTRTINLPKLYGKN